MLIRHAPMCRGKCHRMLESDYAVDNLSIMLMQSVCDILNEMLLFISSLFVLSKSLRLNISVDIFSVVFYVVICCSIDEVL